MVGTEVQAGRDGWPFEDRLRLQISSNLERFRVRQCRQKNGMRRAAVALALVNVGEDSPVYGMRRAPSGEAALVLTRRSQQLEKHAGQWALPGGTIDKGETAETAALRELREEVGIDLEAAAVLGRLDDFSTRSGFTISPVVVWAGEDPGLTPNPAEVASIHRIPLVELMRDDAPVLQEIPESDNPVLLMPVGTGWIASPTGAVLYQFREVALQGREVRVAHYEQPYFAWR